MLRTARDRWITAGTLGVILLAAFWAYAPALQGPFVYDDLFFVDQNDAIKDPRRLPAMLADPATASEGKRWGTIFRPLRTVSYALDYGGWRSQPFGYHLTSLLAHLAAVLGVFALALRWSGHLAGSLLGAALFALHPVPAEAGLFIGARSDVLAVLPVVALALLALAPGPRTRGRTAGEVALLLAALGCKEAAAAAVPAIALALWLRDPAPGGFWRAVRWSIPGVVTVGIYGILRTLAVGHGSRYDYLAGGDMLLTWGSALRARVFELGQILRPDFLSPSYLGVPVMEGWADAAFWLACCAVAGCGWVAWRCRRRAPTVTAGIGWWVLFLLPTSQLIPLNMLMGNRWLYAPFVGLAAIVAATVAAAQRRWGAPGRWALAGAGCVWLLVCAAQTRARAAEWADPVRLWTAAAAAWPEDPAVHSGLIAALANRAERLTARDPAAAEALRRRAVDAAFELADRQPHSEVLPHVAATVAGAGRPLVARRLLERSRAGAPHRSFEATLRLALLRWETGDRPGAAALFDELTAPEREAAVTVDRTRRGEVFYTGGEPTAEHRGRARAVVWLERARLEFVEGRLDRADHAARAAAREWPGSQMAVWARATLLRHAGQSDMAGIAVDKIWREAAVQPLYELRAELAALKGFPEAALQSRARAAARWPFAPKLWDALGTQYERMGNFDVARACFARRTDVAR